MTQITTIPETIAGPALRLELIRLLLPVAGRDVVDVARCAEDYIIGPSQRPAPRTMAAPIIMPGAELATTVPAQIGDTAVTIASAPAAHARPLPVIERGETTVTDLLVNRREELLRWWLAGKKVSGVMTEHFSASRFTIARALKAAGISQVFPRGNAGRPGYDLVPLDAPLPPSAQELLSAEAEEAPQESSPPPEPVRMANGTSPVIWTEDRKARLKDMVAEGSHIDFMAADLGLTGEQVKDQIKRQCLTATWIEGKSKRDGAPSQPTPKLAPAREPLPEDRLRHVAEPEPAAPATMDFVADYLRGCGQDVGLSDTGAWTLDGCVIPPRRLLAAANQYRAAASLPPFSVRGI